MKAWRAVITYAHPENGGSQEWWDRVNMAYECLSNGWCRIAYVDALIRFNLDDGQVVYVEFQKKLEMKRQKMLSRKLKAIELGVQSIN